MMTADTMDLNLPKYGTLRGIIDHERQVAVFRNVPYATVPERWRPAVKAKPWSGVRDATKQGPICPQTVSQYPLTRLLPEEASKSGAGTPFGLEHDEVNALNLNIFVPLQALESTVDDAEKIEPIPVMAWIHGGALRDGSNGVLLYDASNFVQRSIQLKQPVIVVTVNYRLNVFGFIASRELQQEMKESSSSLSPYEQSIGNWGLMDQKLAFEWIRSNIDAFGGNTRNITAFGESAGSISLHYHMILPSHHGLFDHAIMQSGTVETMPPGHVHKEGQAQFNALLQALNIPLDLGWEEKMKRLRAVSTDELTIAGDKTAAMGFRCYYDHGKIFPKIPIHTLAKDLSAYDPNVQSVMLGTTKDEGTAFGQMIFGERTVERWPLAIQMLTPAPQLAELFQSIYGTPATDEDVVQTAARVAGDMIFHYSTEIYSDTFLELTKTRDGFKFSRYHFDAEIEKMGKLVPGLGSLHAGELLFLFAPPSSELVLTEQELQLSRDMQALWIAFANQKEYTVKPSSHAEAYVLTKDYAIEIGESRRLKDQAIMFWGHIAQAIVKKVQAGFLDWEE
ncbi:hypothetical protein BGZ50_007802 [Haplosporangium sp. Z 11]|nr:hypothetical protein BGZ50_007802 [Haplosporangium sp. Z 11]